MKNFGHLQNLILAKLSPFVYILYFVLAFLITSYLSTRVRGLVVSNVGCESGDPSSIPTVDL